MSVWKAKKPDIRKSLQKFSMRNIVNATYEIDKYDGNHYTARFSFNEDFAHDMPDPFIYAFTSDAGSTPWQDFRKSVFADIMFADAMCRYTSLYLSHTYIHLMDNGLANIEIPSKNPQTPIAQEIADAIVDMQHTLHVLHHDGVNKHLKVNNYMLTLRSIDNYTMGVVVCPWKQSAATLGCRARSFRETYKSRDGPLPLLRNPEEILCMLEIDYDLITDHNSLPLMMLINIIANHFAYKCGDTGVVPLPQLGPFTQDTVDIKALIKLNNLQTVMQSK
jgi:hypothetical protein